MSRFTPAQSDDLIRTYAWPLLVRQDDRVLASGTACAIGSGLLLTAKHVVEDWVEKYGVTKNPKGGFSGGFGIMAHQQAGREEFLWEIDTTWLCPLTDIALMRVSPFPKDDPRQRPPWRRWKLNLLPPAPGTPIAAFGYHDTSGVAEGPLHTRWTVKASSSEGTVVEIHRIKRDNTRLKFPVFRIDARLDGSMSGGPVVNNETGELCGLVCSSMPPMTDAPDEGHVSYAASLWPALGTVLRGYRDTDGPTTLLDLACEGVIHASALDRFLVTDIRDDGRTVDMRAEFPKIEGTFQSVRVCAKDVFEITFSISVDGSVAGQFVATADAADSERDVRISSFTPRYAGPWDEEDFGKIVGQYLTIVDRATTSGDVVPAVNFKMAAQHLGRPMS